MVLRNSKNSAAEAGHGTSNPRSQYGVAAVVEVHIRSTSHSQTEH